MKFATAEQIFLRQIVIRVSELHVEKRDLQGMLRFWVHALDSEGAQYLNNKIKEVDDRIALLTRNFNNINVGFTL